MNTPDHHTERELFPKLAEKFLAWREEKANSGRKTDVDGAYAEGASLLLADAVRERASDLHLEPWSKDVRIRLRIDGKLLDAAVLDKLEAGRLMGRLKTMSGVDPVPLMKPADGMRRFEWEGRELFVRYSFSPCYGGEKAAIRILDPVQIHRRVQELGLRDEQRDHIEEWLKNSSGMFLVVGPTGSGKTSTLYALLHEMKLLQQSVVALEEPIEYGVDGITQIAVNEQRGMTFGAGIKAMLRLDPDTLLIGEIRDSSSAGGAVDASATGKIVLSTLHSRDAAGAITTLRNNDVLDHEIAAALDMVVAQRLVRRLCTKCREPIDTPEPDRRRLQALGIKPPAKVWISKGCSACRNTGFHGRTGIFEIWSLNDEAKQRILDHTDEKALRGFLRDSGVHGLLKEGMIKVADGTTSMDELWQVAGSNLNIPENVPSGDR